MRTYLRHPDPILLASCTPRFRPGLSRVRPCASISFVMGQDTHRRWDLSFYQR